MIISKGILFSKLTLIRAIKTVIYVLFVHHFLHWPEDIH